MSETVSLEFIGSRLDSLQRDFADVRRRMVELTEKMGDVNQRISSLERRFSTQEVRLDALVERISNLEALTHRLLFFVERLAREHGIEGPP